MSLSSPSIYPSSPLLSAKLERRDELIRRLWSVMREISDHCAGEQQMSDEDLNLWLHVTNHSAIQSRLDAAAKR